MNLSVVELQHWHLYLKKYGSLHPGMRIDRAVSRVGTRFLNLLARNARWESLDLSPYDVAIREEEEGEVTIEQAFAAISAAARNKR